MPLMDWTEFVLPNGSKRERQLEVPQDVYDKSEQLRAQGYTFTCEVLRTGDAVFYVTDNSRGQDADMLLISHGEAKPDGSHMQKVNDLIMRFDHDKYVADADTHADAE